MYVTFIRRTSGESLRTSEKKKQFYSYREALKIKTYAHFLLSPLNASFQKLNNPCTMQYQ